VARRGRTVRRGPNVCPCTLSLQALLGPKTRPTMSAQELARQMKRTAAIMRKEERLRDHVMQAQRRFRADLLQGEVRALVRTLCQHAPLPRSH